MGREKTRPISGRQSVVRWLSVGGGRGDENPHPKNPWKYRPKFQSMRALCGRHHTHSAERF